MRSSWVITIFQALPIDYRKWKWHSITRRNFNNNTIAQVGATIIIRLKGVSVTGRNNVVHSKMTSGQFQCCLILTTQDKTYLTAQHFVKN